MIKKVSYLPRPILAILALLIAHLIVAETQHKPTLQLIRQLNYQLAMGFSWPFTYLLLWWIHYFTKRLDRQFPWQASWIRRLRYQFILCVFVVLLGDVLVVRIYFWIFDADFSRSGYMQIEFAIICWMVLFMNAAYIAWYFSLNYFHSMKMAKELRSQIETMLAKAAVPVELKIDARLGNKVLQVPVKDIACFERHENIGHVHLMDGRIFYVDLTMPALLEMLKGKKFYQINRSVLISLAVVKGYQKVKNLQAEVILIEGIHLGVSLLISRNRLEGFKEALDQR